MEKQCKKKKTAQCSDKRTFKTAAKRKSCPMWCLFRDVVDIGDDISRNKKLVKKRGRMLMMINVSGNEACASGANLKGFQID